MKKRRNSENGMMPTSITLPKELRDEVLALDINFSALMTRLLKEYLEDSKERATKDALKAVEKKARELKETYDASKGILKGQGNSCMLPDDIKAYCLSRFSRGVKKKGW